MGAAWDALVDGARGVELAAFGDAATYTPATGAPYAVSGVLNFDQQDVDADSNAVISSSSVSLQSVKASVLQGQHQDGDKVTMTSGRYNGKTFRVLTWDPDGQGGYDLRLHSYITGA